MSPSLTSTLSASYTDCSEIVPISRRTVSATTSAVTCGSADTTRITASRCAVTWMPRSRSWVAWSVRIAS